MNKHFISVVKTARFFTQGELGNHTKFIWLVIHGYAQTADHLLRNFEHLGSEHFIIAPEGLNKLYSRGFSGTPVASWMTSLERETEIRDYLNYLNQLTTSFPFGNFPDVKTIVLGFSQGVATSTRFINDTNFRIDHSVMVAGEIGKEFQIELPEKLKTLKSLYLSGDEESIIKSDVISGHKKIFQNSNCQFEEFAGKHEVNKAAISKIISWVEKL